MNTGMPEAIAMHRSGNLSRRTKRENEKMLTRACFGSVIVTREMITGADERPPQTNKERAAQLRGYAVMAGKRQAKILLKQAAGLEAMP